jgi:hypothetical protein
MTSYTVLESNILDSLYSFEKELFYTRNLELAKKIALYYAKKKYGGNVIEKNKIKKKYIHQNGILFYTNNSDKSDYIYSIIKN